MLGTSISHYVNPMDGLRGISQSYAELDIAIGCMIETHRRAGTEPLLAEALPFAEHLPLPMLWAPGRRTMIRSSFQSKNAMSISDGLAAGDAFARLRACAGGLSAPGQFLSSAKNRSDPIPGVPWYQALFAHSVIRASFVGVILGSPALAIAELVAHALIDDRNAWGGQATT